MRSCLVQLFLMVAIVFGLLWFGLPIGAAWLATNALKGAGFTGSDTVVTVTADPPLLLLTGHADKVHVTSNAVSVGDLQASAVDLTLGKVDLIGRSVGSIEGTLTGVSIAVAGGDAVTAQTVTVSGPASGAKATLVLPTTEVEGLAETQLAADGLKATITLAAPNKVTIAAGGKSIPAQLEATDGILLLVPGTPGVPIVPLLTPGKGNPFHVTAVSIGAAGVTLTGTVDLQSMLGL